MRQFLTLLCLVSATALAPVLARADDASLLGSAIGAAAGGLVGSAFGHGGAQVAMTGLGIVAGGAAGNAAAHAIEADYRVSAPAPQPMTLYSDASPLAYSSSAPNYVAPAVPPPTYVDQHSGAYCRPSSQEISTGGGHWREIYETVCLQPDGTWRVIQ